jgi:Mn2+/Fe2+ NRAMP family transporter
MATYRNKVYKAFKNQIDSSPLTARTLEITYFCRLLFGYLGKLAQQQGLSFIIGIAVGVNLILLFQTSEDIVHKLYETSTVSVIGITAIICTIAFGIAIIYMQRKTNRRISTFIGYSKGEQ